MNESTDRDARLRSAFDGPPGPDERRDDCPPADAIWRARSGDLDATARRVLIDHTAACAECAEAWRVAGDLGAGEGLAAARPDPRAWLRTAGLAAALLLALGLVVWRQSRGRLQGMDEYRDGAALAIRTLTPEDRPQPRSGLSLRWTPGPAGTTYDVSLTTEELLPVARARDLAEPRFDVPAAATGRLPAGATLVWRVVARLPDGSLVTSPAFVVRLE